MSVRGVGVDVVDVPGFARQLAEPHSGFADGTFTAAERATCGSGPGDPAARLAARFAAKEAFVKAWAGSRLGRPPALGAVDLREIEVVLDAWGRPALRLHGAVAAAVGPGTTPLVSLSHDGPAAVAMVVLETSAPVAVG